MKKWQRNYAGAIEQHRNLGSPRKWNLPMNITNLRNCKACSETRYCSGWNAARKDRKKDEQVRQMNDSTTDSLRFAILQH